MKLTETTIGKDGVLVGDPYVFVRKGGKQFKDFLYKERG